MARRALNYVILGAPGGGKGTISKKIVQDFNFHHISTGDMLRRASVTDTDLGMSIRKTLKAGQLVSDDLIFKMLDSEVTRLGSDVSLLFDGFPRTVSQAAQLQKLRPVDGVLVLDVPHDVIIARMANRWIHHSSGRTYAYDYNPPKVKGLDDVTGEPLEQREDDKPATVKARLDGYQRMIDPILQFYENIGGADASVKGGDKHCEVAHFSGSESDKIYEKVHPYLENALAAVESRKV